MANVIRLSTRRNGDITASEPETPVATAKTSMLESGARLIDIAKELSRQFDAVENAINTIGDAEARTRLKQSTKLSRDALLEALLDLSQRICEVVNQSGA
jgi:hypothetical protein